MRTKITLNFWGPYRERMVKRAFTLIELMVVIAVVAMIMLWLFAAFFNTEGRPIRINCASDLKQVGWAFRIWEGDNGDRYPMTVLTNKFGEPEFATAALAYRYFQVMSNELNDPKILICPADTNRKPATNFTSDFNGSHISYFIGLEADESRPQMFLSGDSNLTNGLPLKDGIMAVTTNHPAGWTAERHINCGNVLLADGSVQQWSSMAFHGAVSNTGVGTNRLLFP